jgi:hypothetical protein
MYLPRSSLGACFSRGGSPCLPNRPCRRAYDHRLRDLVCEERDRALFPQLGIPRSTAASWIRRGSRDIVTTKLFAEDELALRALSRSWVRDTRAHAS